MRTSHIPVILLTAKDSIKIKKKDMVVELIRI